MGQSLDPIIIDSFDGGVADDVRAAAPNEFAVAHHFDIYSKRHKLIPYRDMEAEAGSLSAYAIKSVVLFTDSAGTQAFFALGNVSGQTYPQILEKTTIAGTFAESTTGAGAAGTVIATTLVGYKQTNKLYFMKTSGGNTIIDSYDPATNTYASTVGTIVGTSSSGVYPRPFRHPLDDILYFAAGNIVAKLDNTTFTAAALTLPSNLIVTSMTDYGIYLAVACAPKDQGNESYVFLWGRDTSIVELDESIPAGVCALMVLENLQGELIGVASAAQSAGTVVDIAPKIILSVFSGSVMKPFKEIVWAGTGTPTTLLQNHKAKRYDKLYFAAKQYIENKTVNQLWVVGKNQLGEFFVTPDKLVNNDTALTGNVDGFSMIGDYTWVAYNGDGSLKRTDDGANHTATAIYESGRFNSGSSRLTKKIKGISVMFDALSSGQTVVLKYKKDEETSFTQIFTFNTANSLFHSAVNIESSGAELPHYKEIAFRVESTGGAAITGLNAQPELISADIY